MTTAPAADALAILETMASDAEATHRYGTKDKRTIEHSIAENVTLLVCAEYTAWGERMASYNTQALINHHVKVHVVGYGVLAPGRITALPLTRDEAVTLLETRELPARWYAPIRAVDDSDPFEGLVAVPYVGRNAGPARVAR